MKFNDLYFSKSGLFSVGVEEDSGSYYISIPVSNNLVDYEEYYRLDKETFDKFSNNLEQLKFIADECRDRLRDNYLFYKPGTNRGHPR